ncbi:hypothetical protein SAMD00023353_0700810 [Rosellinia necatrix]|uniref:Nineteen complex-related protein 2 domain-containing protein n=1 Tax=Rosellinia necatrix TaxID=77044 RepID=A0A1S7ULS7_ROSNE|nr:hypothetical protein SAMD00023353_0700810 [Rosellinia necatrix]
MSSFASKRKARKITVQDDEEPPPIEALNPPPEPQEPALEPTFKSRKPFKQSSLRKSVNFGDETLQEDAKARNSTDEAAGDHEDDGTPVRIRPSTIKSGVAKSKKRQSSSRLSFGPSETTAGDDDDDDAMILGEGAPVAPATEKHAYKKSIPKNLPFNRLSVRSMEDDDDRPKYSKEYLSELQSATPNTPQDLSKLHITSEEDEMSLDPSELEGAMIVDTSTSVSTSLAVGPTTATTTSILTEAEIREKKERRARFAKQKGSRDTEDFISLSDDDNNRNNDERGAGDSYLTMLSRRSGGGKSDTRLVAEDEDLGEGFDEFVEDGGLSLGRKAEREARRRHRAEMASMISAAEGGSDGDAAAASDDSEAERRAAFEAAQTRAGMDGLAEEREQQRRKRLGDAREGVVPVPARIAPLPDLSVLVEAFKARMRQKEADLVRLRAHLAALRAEREGVLRREPEVQRLLNEAGERYRALMMPGADGNGDGKGHLAESNNNNGNNNAKGEGTAAAAAARTLLDQFRDDPGTPVGRGLESLGTTPVRQAQMEL